VAAPHLEEHDPQVGLIAPCPCHTGTAPYRFWHDDKGPGPLLQARHGTADHNRPAPWCDHFYRLRDRRRGEWVYVAEPYQLHDDAFSDFVYLREHGWHVEVTSWRARHYPGHTVAVVIRKHDD